MKELYDLHEKILARGIKPGSEQMIIFSIGDIDDEDELLPDDLIAEVEAIQAQFEAVLPADFDFEAIVGSGTGPSLNLLVNEIPVGVPEEEALDHGASIFPQLEKLDWERLRKQVVENAAELAGILHLADLLINPGRSAKTMQRLFREDAKDFIKQKRKDAARIHLLCWLEDDLKSRTYADGDELREKLPVVLYAGAEVITIVAGGKPLPVEKIDAITAEARKNFKPIVETAERLAAQETGGDDVSEKPIIDIESSEVSEG